MELRRTPIARSVDVARKKGNALLLSCMDLRMIDETAWLMHELEHHNEYDHVAIAGASLGVLTDRAFDEWAHVAWPALADAVVAEAADGV